MFFVTSARGLEDVVAKELEQLGAKRIQKGLAGCSFESNWAGVYKINLMLRSGSRVLYPVLDFVAYEPDQIYHNILKHDWTKYIDIHQTLSVDTQVRESVMRDLRIISLKTKDAVVDQFREKYDRRPDVDTENPDLNIMVRVVKNQVTVALNTSGDSLHLRGYRKEISEAPMKENLAAALLQMTGWNGKTSIVDPLCGSGTILIEAALLAQGRPPGMRERRFGFENWKTFQKEAYEKIKSEVFEIKGECPPLFGFDRDQRLTIQGQASARKMGLSDVITFQKGDARKLVPPVKEGMIVINPPYGERIKEEDLLGLYQELGKNFRENFKDFRLWVLMLRGDQYVDAFGLPLIKRHLLFNGSIPCQFVELEIPY